MMKMMTIEEIEFLMNDNEPKEPIIESKERTYIHLMEDLKKNNSLDEIGERHSMVQKHVQETADELKRLVHLLKELNKFKEIEPELFI